MGVVVDVELDGIAVNLRQATSVYTLFYKYVHFNRAHINAISVRAPFVNSARTLSVVC